LILGVAVVCADLATTSHPHEIFFYDQDSELIAVVAEYVGAGMAAGEPIIVIATAAHRAAIEMAISHAGVDVSLARATGGYVALDAAETLDSFMVHGLPDADRFARVAGTMFDAAPGVRAFGEMVALLWHQGNVSGAMALETLWNDLAEDRQFSLLCAYPTTALHSAELRDVNRVSHLHSAVLPPSSYGSGVSRGSEDGAATFSRVFVGVPEAVAASRRFVAGTLTLWGQDDLVWDGALIVSELATNAVIHGGSPFRGTIERGARVVRIAVEDVGPGLPHRRRMPDDALSGRGVAIVEELAHRWGCDLTHGGKAFWAELEATIRPT